MSAEAEAEARLEQIVALATSWEPGFGDGVAGASDADIAGIEDGLGVALAPEHRAFLRRMGADVNGINAYGDDVLDLRAPALRAFVDAGFNPDPSLFVIAGVPRDPTTHWLVFDRRGGAAPTPLVRLGAGAGDAPVVTTEHSDLFAMLSTFAFITKCLPRFDWEQHLESPGARLPSFAGVRQPGVPDHLRGRWLPRFCWIAQQLGFVTVGPDTGPWSVCAQREDAAVMMYECPAYSPDVRVAARDRLELARLLEIFSDNLELRARPTSLRRPP